MEIVKAKIQDAEFIFETLKILAGDVEYSLDRFELYLNGYFNRNSSDIYLAKVDNAYIGLITLNRFDMPRYCGYGVEMEEVVIIESERGKGHGAKFINQLIEEISEDLELRKIIVKTDDVAGSGKLYGRIFDQKTIVTYQKYVNSF